MITSLIHDFKLGPIRDPLSFIQDMNNRHLYTTTSFIHNNKSGPIKDPPSFIQDMNNDRLYTITLFIHDKTRSNKRPKYHSYKT